MNDPKPYAAAANLYRSLGWQGVLPLPKGKKSPPPDGWTGARAPYPTDAQVAEWLATNADGNVGLRMPPNVIGYDVDHYDGKVGGETHAANVAKWGELPPTWTSTARTGVSGIRFFRVPEGLAWPGNAGDDIEIVQRKHRYAAVWPSTNPRAGGAMYRWRDPAGNVAMMPPAVDALPELPQTWVDGLTGGQAENVANKADLDSDAVAEWLERHGGTVCGHLAGSLAQGLQDLEETGSRHESALASSMVLVSLGHEGHTGAAAALEALGAAFIDHVSGEREPGAAEREWARMLHGAVELVEANGKQGTADPCAEDWSEFLDTPESPEGETAGDQETRPNPFWSATLTVSGLANLPKPKPLIADTLDLHTTALLTGQWGTYKSFVALDWALSVATGTEWMGREVQQGRVVYIVAEGAYGMRQRVQAWSEVRGVTVPDDAIAFYPKAAQLSDAELMGAMRDGVEDFSLVVIDTFAKSTVGMDENSAKDIGQMFQAADEVQQSMRHGMVLMVHHQGYDDKKPTRGSTALPGAVDTIYTTSAKGDLAVLLERKKRKDGPLEDRVHIEMQEVDLGTDDPLEMQRTTSLVPVKGESPEEGGEASAPIETRIAEYVAANPGATGRAIYAHIRGSRTAYKKALDALVADGYVVVSRVGSAEAHTLTREYSHLKVVGGDGAQG